MRIVFTALAIASCLGTVACDGAPAQPAPNVLWVIWDTVRADRLGLYANDAPTTPNLDRLAATGRVFDCTSVSCWTLPSHASMFTGLHPSEHGLNAHDDVLDEGLDTVAELLRDRGYRTYLFSANPFVSSSTGLAQGFDVEEHPYDEPLAETARRVVLDKLEEDDRSHSLHKALTADEPRGWSLKAVAALVTDRFFEFLESDDDRPFFAVLNYMDAHRIRVPPRPLRERMLDERQVRQSYEFDQTQRRMQAASLGLGEEFSDDEIAIIRGVYDATLLELDQELERLFARLADDELLDDTVVILVSDHGEHLGDHGSFLHQYSLYEGVLRVPLVVWAPGRLAAGREPLPVSNADLFPTVLELAGIDPPLRPGAASLLEPRSGRTIVAEYLEPYAPVLRRNAALNPDWDATRFERRLHAVRVGPHKYLEASDGSFELFDVVADFDESDDLAGTSPEMVESLAERLRVWRETASDVRETGERTISPEEEERLRALGYL